MECPTPTITNVCDNKVYFDLNGANATSVSMRFSETNEGDWDVSIGSYIGGYTSPRTLSSPYDTGFIKLRTACSGGVYSDSSEAFAFDTEKSCNNPGSSSCFFPTMVIDDISNCELTYHFNEYTPFSSTDSVPLWRSYDNINWNPVTSNITSPAKIFSHGQSGTVYLKYRQKCGSDYEFSQVYSYDMPYQSCYSCTTIKTDWNGNPFTWSPSGVYDSDRNLLMEINYVDVQSCTYNPYAKDYFCSSTSKIDYSDGNNHNPPTTADICPDNPNSSVAFSCTKLTVHPTSQYINVRSAEGYIPMQDNNWAKISISRGLITSVKQYAGGTLYDCR